MKFKTINGWTKESMIDYIKKEFKGRSVDIYKNICLYRGPEGKKCIVGLFIPDNLYKPELEGKSLKLHIENNNVSFNEIIKQLPLPYEAMQYLQLIHDRDDLKNTLDEILYWIEKNVE